ncbi:hypothetical protein HETIRDRAFT_383952 [Heterobasidion irregulare TC 32-1]|uniref:Uncharacterized protein n=1 Tax=Heterobasidion irregulare (strain TC 32-1) TaxID=747525 RepID=W4K8B1_HETIT|nr:uncharacterized protein HETIRDRAFT_383952 [Heterobasidion irregulare TC 32-1]ETW81590.1 hypothetical protein HETIRDRAFT_383952 [Heterobasidion irregulare TC 32-1]
MEESAEPKALSRFEKHDEFTHLQQSLLTADLNIESSVDETRNETNLLQRLLNILNEYQEQAYLLDPFLEVLVTPIVDKLKGQARHMATSKQTSHTTTRLSRLTILLYSYIKFRFFPHEVTDLSIALQFMQILEKPSDSSLWSLRYVTLLWLSLICMIPFDLSQFDTAEQPDWTAGAIEAVAKGYLGKAGLEREGGAILLSRLYVRKDTHHRLTNFLQWSDIVTKTENDTFPCIGALQTLCEVIKISPVDILSEKLPSILDVARAVAQNASLMDNAIIRKLRIKLISRSMLRLLPARHRSGRRIGRILTSVGGYNGQVDYSTDEEQETDVPEDIETVLEELFNALQDRVSSDTVVRWSAAKGVARLSERLPKDFAAQVLDTVLGLFSIHSMGIASIYDMPATAESTWHGACLACAEMARRGLVADDKLPELLEWMSKALYFDIRKGTHSIGSSVRDSAAYVLWSLARSHDTAVIGPFAANLARHIVSVSVYDREIHIRRATSAAFQEHVGRMGIFPHGIDVLGKTDFFAVGIRRNAYLVAAPQVAVHDEYRPSLINHLLTVTLRHWDSTIRELGAKSLRKICELDLSHLGPECALKIHEVFETGDSNDAHGALLALAELACGYRESDQKEVLEKHRCEVIFSYLAAVPLVMIQSPRHELVTAAACRLIATSISLSEIQLEQRSSVPHWRKIIDTGLKHRNSDVQEAAAEALGEVSKLVDCSPVRPSAWTVKGHQVLDGQCGPFNLKPDSVCSLFNALINGLEDYTTDERGDVGSWVRIACIQGLTSFSLTMLSHADHIPGFADYFPSDKYQIAVAGILKQGIERLDNVRAQAGVHIVRLLNHPLPSIPGLEAWHLPGDVLMRNLFPNDAEFVGWHDGLWVYPRVIQLLELPVYRHAILSGLLMSIGSRTESTQRPAANSLVGYVRKLPLAVTQSDAYDVQTLAADLVAHARRSLGNNNVVIPVLQTFNLLLEAETLDVLAESPEGLKPLRLLFNIVSRGVAKLKSVHRILACMTTVINLMAIPKMYDACVPVLSDFLAHQYPKVRADAAEALYLLLQTRDVGKETDEVEEVLLETEWLSSNIQAVKEAAKRVEKMLS